MANKKIEEMTDDELEAKIKFNRDTTSLWRSVFVVGTASLAFVGALIVTGVVLPLVLPIASIALCWGMIMGIYRQPDLRGDAKDFATEKTRLDCAAVLMPFPRNPQRRFQRRLRKWLLQLPQTVHQSVYLSSARHNLSRKRERKFGFFIEMTIEDGNNFIL